MTREFIMGFGAAIEIVAVFLLVKAIVSRLDDGSMSLRAVERLEMEIDSFRNAILDDHSNIYKRISSLEKRVDNLYSERANREERE